MSGKFHANVEGFLNSKLITSKDAFMKAMDNDTFFSYRYINPQAAVALFDGITVLCKNPIHISATVYDSKCLITICIPFTIFLYISIFCLLFCVLLFCLYIYLFTLRVLQEREFIFRDLKKQFARDWRNTVISIPEVVVLIR